MEVKEEWFTPGFPGSSLGYLNYRSHVIQNGDVPPLLSLPSLRGQKAVIDCPGDALYLPVGELNGVIEWAKLPLEFHTNL